MPDLRSRRAGRFLRGPAHRHDEFQLHGLAVEIAVVHLAVDQHVHVHRHAIRALARRVDAGRTQPGHVAGDDVRPHRRGYPIARAGVSRPRRLQGPTQASANAAPARDRKPILPAMHFPWLSTRTRPPLCPGLIRARRFWRSSLVSDTNRLLLQVHVHHGAAVFTTDARLLETAERHVRIQHIVRVDPDRARRDARDQALHARQIVAQMLAPRPNTLSLARRTASSSVSKGWATTTGPKISRARCGHRAGRRRTPWAARNSPRPRRPRRPP